MTVSVTEFKARCLEILRTVEQEGRPVEISKQGRVRFRIVPVTDPEKKAWEALRGSGRLKGSPEDSVLSEDDFSANR